MPEPRAPRELLAEADDIRRRIRAMDSLRTSMRLQRPVGWRPRLREFFVRHDHGDGETRLTSAEASVFYEWLEVREAELFAEAQALEARVVVTSEGADHV